ncbi:hypothetical protein EYF80_049124 [Liparis tanakae]|uniref:Uncharacterized protein n=1 Tax=Liparis tanakae TaxID=230148 RepID=A0A4Z2FHJ4_9TELE|nr:hypothetical protein EYF80_049124 [Liparis tanakae]
MTTPPPHLGLGHGVDLLLRALPPSSGLPLLARHHHEVVTATAEEALQGLRENQLCFGLRGAGRRGGGGGGGGGGRSLQVPVLHLEERWKKKRGIGKRKREDLRHEGGDLQSQLLVHGEAASLDLVVQLAVLQVFAGRIVAEQSEAGQLRLPGADPLVQHVEELLHRGGAVEAHHLHAGGREDRSHHV